ncbi:MAG: sensor histidine kinase [Parasphingopyxis sp.]|uniref:sensor histidine kinase n=1 Tax=Parasphingopyxis sp. TaxID=1920299 RepID=UPI003F9F5BC8
MLRPALLGRLFGLMLMLCVAGVAFAAASAPEPRPAPRPAEGWPVAFDLYHDPTGRMDVTTVAAREDLDWRRTEVAFARYGTGTLWLRIPALSDSEILSLSNMPDRAVLYEPAPGAFDWREQQTGDTLRADDRAYPAAQPAFRLTPDLPGPGDRFLKIEQPNWLNFRLQAWHEEDFRAYIDRAQIIRILALGFCGAIIFYNLVVSVLARDRIFAFNAMTILSLVLLDAYLTGTGGYWLWPDAPWLSNIVLALSIGMTIFFGSQFIGLMLRHGQAGPHTLAQIRWSGYAALGLGLSAIILPYWWPLIPLVLLAVAFVLVVLFHVMRLALKGDAHAGLLVAPFALAVVPGLALVMASAWAGAQFGWLRDHLLEFTLVFEALAFSLVLAARMRLHMADAADAKSALAELKQQAAERFTRLQDQERARIAADLHDSLGHTLAMAGAQFEALRSHKGLDDETRERADYGLVTLREAIGETRRISHALHPTTLTHLGWQQALRTMVEDFAKNSGLEAEITIHCPQQQLDEAQQTHLIRLVQEALSNIGKHSQASQCRISVRDTREGTAVDIADNGVGIGDADRLAALREDDSALGLFSMRQRAAQLGGALAIANREEGGLRLSFTISKDAR